MKIVYCILDCSSPGGTERALSLQANYFAERGVEVHIITTEVSFFKEKSYSFSDQISFHNLDINYRSVDNKLSPIKIINRLIKGKRHRKKLSKILHSLKPDFTIGMFGHESSFLYKIDDGSKKILEYHFSKHHRKIEFSTAIFWKRWFALLREQRKCSFIKKYDAFIVLTQKDAANWKNLNNLHVIPNAIPFIPAITSKCESKKAISVGRLSSEKGYELLIAVWQQVVLRYPDWILEIYGTGSEYDRLCSIVKEHSLKNNIFIKDPVRNIEEKYIESSIYLMSSYYEGFGIVLIEAMACGLPCISFDCPCGPSEILTNSDDGFLIPAYEIHEMVDKICLLIADSDLRKRMGQKAQENVMRYSLATVMHKWENLFEKLK